MDPPYVAEAVRGRGGVLHCEHRRGQRALEALHDTSRPQRASRIQDLLAGHVVRDWSHRACALVADTWHAGWGVQGLY